MHGHWVDWLRLALVAVLVLANAYFVAAEFALVTVRWTRVEQLVAQNRFGAKAVSQALERINDAIAACQVGITFASLALGWIGEPALANLIEPWFHGVPPVLGYTLSHGIAVVVAYLGLTYLHVVLGEQAPKALALQRAEDVALVVTGPLLTFGRAFRPFIRLIGSSSNWAVRMLRPRQRRECCTAWSPTWPGQGSTNAGRTRTRRRRRACSAAWSGWSCCRRGKESSRSCRPRKPA